MAGASVELSAPTRDTIARTVLWPGWLVTAALVLPFLFGVSVPLRVQAIPLAVSVVAFGLPHGAVDHLAVPRVQGRSPSPRLLGLVGLLYLCLGLAYAVVWFLTPALAFALFVLLTLFHWGQGDLYSLLAFLDVGYLDSRPRRLLAVVVRGGFPMVVPLLAFPDWYRRVGRALVSLFELGSVSRLGWLFRVETRLTIAVVYGTVVVGYLAAGYVRAGTDRSAWLVDAGEMCLLGGYFLTVPPLLAIGVYFCCWHSLRHIVRLVVLDETTRDAIQTGAVGPALGRFAVEALPLTVLALLGIGGLWLVVPRPPGDVLGRLGLYLVGIALLTLPHTVIVTWMDREQSIW